MDINIRFPKITVLMPVYNCELYIKEAIDSILNQTYFNFEFLIIDDASTDKTLTIIKEYDDTRIKLIEKSVNTGLTNSLNYGLSIAKGEYIARMDGDDISLPNRFEKQVAFLDLNPDVIVCGSFFKIIGKDEIITVPENHEDIKLAMLEACCVGHPTVMMRKKSFEIHSFIYDVSKEPAEDYDLWVRMIQKGKLYNIQEVLLQYRIHTLQTSQKRLKEQVMSATETKLNLLIGKCKNVVHEEVEILKKIILNNPINNIKEIKHFLNLKQKLIKSNDSLFFESKGFYKHLYKLEKIAINNFFLKRKKYTPLIYIHYMSYKKVLDYRFTFKIEFRIFIKSVIFWKING